MSAKHEPNAQQIKDEQLYLQMGMTDEEFERAEKMHGRLPNYTETGLFSALWSEHCSYKSSKPVLRKFPTKGNLRRTGFELLYEQCSDHKAENNPVSV